MRPNDHILLCGGHIEKNWDFSAWKMKTQCPHQSCLPVWDLEATTLVCFHQQTLDNPQNNLPPSPPQPAFKIPAATGSKGFWSFPVPHRGARGRGQWLSPTRAAFLSSKLSSVCGGRPVPARRRCLSPLTPAKLTGGLYHLSCNWGCLSRVLPGFRANHVAAAEIPNPNISLLRAGGRAPRRR